MFPAKGYATGDQADVSPGMDRLETLLISVRRYYETLSPEALLQHPAPGKWSKQQVLGHLIDSAINNLKRFTDAQVMDQPYTIIPYRQDDLMAINIYQQLPLAHLLDLWQSLNRQIVFVVRSIPAEKLTYKVQPQYDETGTQTLAWLICDYVAHMEHHLHQVDFLQ